MARRVMRQRTNRPNGAHMKQGFAIVENLLHCCRLLRSRRERPGSRAAERRDELAALHSITSLACASRLGGTVIPIALAVDRLMTSSNWVGCTTGMSAGFSPLRMRPV
jgi:hypothetical protein